MIDVLKKIWDFSGKEKDNIKKSIFISIIFAIFYMLQATAVYYIVLGVSLGENSYKPGIIAFILLIISIIGRTVCKYSTQLSQTHAGYFMVANKRIELGNKIKKAPMGYLNMNSTGDTVGIMTTVLEEIQNAAPLILINIMSGFLNTVIFTIMMLFFDYRIGLLVLFGVIIYLIISTLMENKSKDLAPIRQDSQKELVDVILEHIQGMHVVKSFNLTGIGDKKVRNTIEKNKKANMDIEKTFTPFIILQSLALNFFSICIMLISIYLYMNQKIDLAKALMGIISSFMVFAQIELVGGSMGSLRIVSSSIDQVEKLMSMPEMDINGEEINPKKKDIRFRNVDFSYGDRKILDDINLYIPEKSSTAIVGPSGSGKTTICNLISRFWDVDKGEILIGGRNIKDYKLDSLMKQISIVFQDVYLFEDSIENNIKFGNSNAGDDEVIEAAKKACCHDFIMSLEDGYKTIIGEGGGTLSGGEKQRISIARAILKDAPIIILDEATANIDPENEDKLQKALEFLTKDKTVIMIAHRLKTIKNADQIIVLNDGKIEQLGKHKELINMDGTYKRFIDIRKKAVGWKVNNK